MREGKDRTRGEQAGVGDAQERRRTSIKSAISSGSVLRGKDEGSVLVSSSWTLVSLFGGRLDFGPRFFGALLGRRGLDFSTIAVERHSRKTW